MNSACKYCGQPISSNFFFCPTCGKKLISPPLSTSVGKQVWLYAISFLLPPFGVWPSIKYIKEPNEKAKIIGVIGLILTVISIIISINIITSMFLSPLGQLQSLQNPGL